MPGGGGALCWFCRSQTAPLGGPGLKGPSVPKNPEPTGSIYRLGGPSLVLPTLLPNLLRLLQGKGAMGQASGTLTEHQMGLRARLSGEGTGSQAWAHVPPPHHSWVTSSRGSPHHTPQSEISRTAVAIG